MDFEEVIFKREESPLTPEEREAIGVEEDDDIEPADGDDEDGLTDDEFEELPPGNLVDNQRKGRGCRIYKA